MKIYCNTLKPIFKTKGYSLLLCLFLYTSCTSVKVAQNIEPQYNPQTQFSDGTAIITSETYQKDTSSILITFAGDIMAHTPNFKGGHYNLIYKDIEKYLKQSDFSFANLEAPVCDAREYSNYPQFNIHKEYAKAAIDAGFNVFSLCNNHSNDQDLEGIKATKEYFDSLYMQTKDTSRPVYSSGLKDTPQSPFTYQVIKHRDFTILYLAVTEILNQNSYSSYINYVWPSKNKRQEFLELVKTLREQNECDMFILSLHTSEPEYVLSVQKEQRDFYYSLLDSGVDVIWANHPHVAKLWEVINYKESGKVKLIFYAQGNTISGQRRNPKFYDADGMREYTGDGFITQVRFEKTSDGIKVIWINPVLITTYITPEYLYVIRELNESFIEELQNKKQTVWASYLTQRKSLMEQIKGNIIWQ